MIIKADGSHERTCSICNGGIHHGKTIDLDEATQDVTHVRCVIMSHVHVAFEATQRLVKEHPEIDITDVAQDDEIFDALANIESVLLDVAKIGGDIGSNQ